MANLNTEFLSFDQIASALLHGGKDRTLIVEGSFGIGKTAIYHKLRRDAAADPKHPLHNHIWTGVLDCTQLSDGSIWMPDVNKELGTSRELPNERFGVNAKNQRGVPGSRPVIVMADEIAKAPQYVKNMLAPILYERRVGAYEFPEGSIVWGATNLSAEGLGDSLQAHLRNRVAVVKMRAPTMDEWVNNFAIPHRLNPSLIATVHHLPKVFETFTEWLDGGKYASSGLGKLSSENPFIFNPKNGGQDACVTPRSLHAVSDWMTNCEGKVDDQTLQQIIAGTAGSPFAKEMLAFIRYGRELPTFEEVIKDPVKTKVPSNPTAQIVQVFQFVTQVADAVQAEAVSKYVMRMKDEMQALFCTVVARTASAQCGIFTSSKTFTTALTKTAKFF